MATILMGLSGGMVPCPAALVILFLAVSLQKLPLGLALILFFSLGLGTTLTFLGILFSKGAGFVEKYDHSRIIPKLPIVSSGIIVLLGLTMMAKALLEIM